MAVWSAWSFTTWTTSWFDSRTLPVPLLLVGLMLGSLFMLPMVAGIIIAAGGDELTIAHPLERATTAVMMLILGGPALYLIGNALFNWELSRRVPWSRLVAIATLVALVPLAASMSALVLMIMATAIVVALVVWDVRGRWSSRRPPFGSHFFHGPPIGDRDVSRRALRNWPAGIRPEYETGTPIAL